MRRSLRMTTLSLLCVEVLVSGCDGSPVAFDPHRSTLYTQSELAGGFDIRVYNEYVEQGKFYPPARIAQLRSAHDDGVATALKDYVHDRQKVLIGIMGSGNPAIRCSEAYRNTARLAWKLTHDGGYLVASGGGPGQMEAANLGAYLADEPIEAIDDALERMRSRAKKDPQTGQVPPRGSEKCEFDSVAYDAAAQSVIDKYPRGHESLGVPTWFYGNEPTNRFATHIAKFFSNGIREDLLVALAEGGIVIAPGSAGTRQEIFMDGTKTFYATFCYVSPTLFLGVKYYGPMASSGPSDPGNPGVYDLVRRLTPADYQEFLTITDDLDEAVRFFKAHPPRRVEADSKICRNMP